MKITEATADSTAGRILTQQQREDAAEKSARERVRECREAYAKAQDTFAAARAEVVTPAGLTILWATAELASRALADAERAMLAQITTADRARQAVMSEKDDLARLEHELEIARNHLHKAQQRERSLQVVMADMTEPALAMRGESPDRLGRARREMEDAQAALADASRRVNELTGAIYRRTGVSPR